MKKKSTNIPAEAIFKKKEGEGDSNKENVVAPVIPTDKEFAEAHTPELSQNTFQIADKTFQLRMSPIKTQKIMATALDAVTDLIKKIDLLPIFRGLQDKLNQNRDKMVAKIKKVSVGDVSTEDIDIVDTSTDYLDMVELIRDVISHGGLGNIMNTILDIYVGIIFAICNSQDKTVSRDWLEDNISFYDAQKIFFMQMEKDRIGGRVIDFLHMLTRQIISEKE
jgi:hypothetical protein